MTDTVTLTIDLEDLQGNLATHFETPQHAHQYFIAMIKETTKGAPPSLRHEDPILTRMLEKGNTNLSVVLMHDISQMWKLIGQVYNNRGRVFMRDKDAQRASGP